MHTHKTKAWFCKTIHALTTGDTLRYSLLFYIVLNNAGIMQTDCMTHKMVTASCLNNACLDICEAIYNSEML